MPTLLLLRLARVSVDTLVLQVYALLHAPTREAKGAIQNTSMPRILEGAGQRACTVPTSTTNAVICLHSPDLFYHTHRKTETQPPLPQIRNDAFIPSHEWRRDFPRRLVKLKPFQGLPVPQTASPRYPTPRSPLRLRCPSACLCFDNFDTRLLRGP